MLRWLRIGVLAIPCLVASPPIQADESERQAILRETFQAAGRGEWERALRLAALADEPLAAKVVRWLRMVEAGEADFGTIARFLIGNPYWPLPDRLQLVAEGRITDPADHALIRRLFAERPPLTTRGHIRYAEALLAAGRDEEATALIRKAWIEGDFSEREEKRFLQRYGRMLSSADHVARLDNLLWDYRRTSANRMLKRVPEGYRRLAQARMRLQRRQNGVDEAIEAVPAALRNDPGLTFDRLRWRRQKHLDRGVVEILLDPPAALGRPGLWWFERELQIRRALRKRDFQLAYRLASTHRQTEGDDFAEAEWLTGWLALRFAKQPNTALGHFTGLYEAVRAPVDRARAAYWAGRSAAALGNPDLAEQWYRTAAAFPIAYYGQLAAEELGEAGRPLPDPAPASEAQHEAFERNELVRVARLLIEADAPKQLTPFLMRLGELANSPTEVGMVAELAASSGRPHLVAQVGRYAAYYGHVHHAAAFPIPEIPGLLWPPPGDPEPALLLGVGRQESMFNPWVNSHADATGLLQLIPRTALLMAGQLGLPYNQGLLAGNPDYNVRLGSHYLKTLLRRYDGEVALALAAYNAGPRRADEWIRLHGDPRQRGRHFLVDWIELIPFDETRNYVQRVLEGRNMYRRRLASGNPVTVPFRPVKGPLEPIPVAALKPLDEVERIRVAEIVARAPRPRLKPDADAPADVVPAEYQSETAPLPSANPDGAVDLAEQPLPEPAS